MQFICRVGVEYNDLTVLVDQPGSGGFITCRCRCGTELKAYKPSVTNGLKKSCGCRRVGAPLKNLVGQTFGSVTVIAQHDNVVTIRCNCGREVERTRATWARHGTCGCVKSIWITVNGERKNLSEWAKTLGMTRAWASKLHQRGDLVRRIGETLTLP